MKKLIYWIVDYTHMIRGATMMYYHRTPPDHYLGHVLEEKASVILIPGIFGRWGFMKKIGDTISLAGHPVYVVKDMGHNLKDIPNSSKYIVDLIVKENLKEVVLVGYSKGGLIGAYTLTEDSVKNNILGMITVATPFSGSGLVKLLPGRIFRDLDPKNAIINELYQNTEIKKKIISIIPFYDNHVWSEKKSYLEGARENIEVKVAGHATVIFDKTVNSLILQSIERFNQ